MFANSTIVSGAVLVRKNQTAIYIRKCSKIYSYSVKTSQIIHKRLKPCDITHFWSVYNLAEMRNSFADLTFVKQRVLIFLGNCGW